MGLNIFITILFHDNLKNIQYKSVKIDFNDVNKIVYIINPCSIKKTKE